MSSPRLLDAATARAYWDERHKRRDSLRSGGDIGLDQAGNETFYSQRLGLLLRQIGSRTAPVGPRTLLDAGCGKGWFSREFARCGFTVTGIDASPAGIEEARSLGGGPTYEVSLLGDFAPPYLYDVVCVIDVLFHLTDDADWAASVTNLASAVKWGGALVIADEDQPVRRPAGDYIVHRTRAEYEALLEPAGYVHEQFDPYLFRHNRIGFHLYRRVA